MRAFLLAVFVCVSAAPASAQSDWKAELKADLVKVADGKMVTEEFSLLKMRVPGYEPADVQVKIRSEAPAVGAISRDNFIALTTTISNLILLSAFADSYNVPASVFLENFDTETLRAPIGKPNLEINIYMTAEGFQLEVVNNDSGEKHRDTQTWKELYAG